MPIVDRGLALGQSSDDFRFAAAVAEFGMLLRGSEHAGNASWDQTRELAVGALGQDRGQYRHEFMALVDKAESLN
ncbi:MAG: DUF3520 domain-containing protein [Myxococcales bacterium]|nr:DUF3520 domain-containing protein [Myxococcales bacterium]